MTHDVILTTAKHIYLLKKHYQRQIGAEPTCAFLMKALFHSSVLVSPADLQELRGPVSKIWSN